MKNLGQWIKQKTSQVKGFSLEKDDHIATDRTEALDMISSFWTQVWSQRQDNEEAAANKLVRDFGVVDLSFT